MHASTKWLIGEIVLVVLVIVVLGMLGHPAVFPYLWHKMLHNLGAVLLLGNIIITAVWIVMAEQTGSRDVLRFAAQAVNWMDVFFTVPGIFLLVWNGDVLAVQWGGVLGAGWITLSLAIFLLSGILWLGFLIRCQHRLIVLSREENPGPEFFRVLHAWYFWGAVATLLPLISLAIMFLKPTFS